VVRRSIGSRWEASGRPCFETERQWSAALAWIADTYREIISAAVAAGDDRQIAEIASEFYDRLFDRPVRNWDVGEIVSNGATWSMKLDDGVWLVRCCSTKQWSISDRPDATNIHCKQHRVAERLGAPLAFLEGLYEGVRSLEQFHGTPLVSLNEKVAKARQDVEKQCELLFHLERQAEKKKKLLSQKNILQEITLRATTDGLTLPAPPKEAITVQDAKDAFKGISGVYFVYRELELWYIGKAYDVAKRLRSKSHPSEETDLVSVVRLPKHRIHLAEMFYIWKYRPQANGEVRLEVRDEQRAEKQTA
jgi:hypothetical protein